MSVAPRFLADDVLLVVDVQNDFCPDGALGVPGGDEVAPIINRIAPHFPHVILTQDWHPQDHVSFASNHPGKKPYDTIALDYGPQVLWPDHCVQGSTGAAFHPALAVPQAELILRKGYHRSIDSYSAFRENDRKTKTGLAAYLRERGLKRLFIAGLAFDYCVRYSAEDAVAEGFTIFVIADGCRAIDLEGSRGAALKSFSTRGVTLIDAAAFT